MTAEVDFGPNAEEAQNLAEGFTEESPAGIAAMLGLPAGSVTSKQPATAEKEFVAAAGAAVENTVSRTVTT